MNIIQEKWLNDQILGLDVIVNNKGKVRAINIFSTSNENLVSTFYREYKIKFGQEIFLNDLMNTYDDPWSEIQIYDSLEYNDKIVYCGEGEMGNEGFIVQTDKNNIIEWMLFSSESNPFTKIEKTNDLIYIKSTHNFYIEFNSVNNEISIVNTK